MALEYFPCYHSYRKKIAKLSDQEVGRLFRCLLEYSERGETEELEGLESIAFDFIADDIDRAKASYEEKCSKNRANAAGRKRSAATDDERSQDKDKDKDETKDETKDEYKDETEYETEYEANKRESTERRADRPPSAGRFLPPSVEEVKAFCRERGSELDAQRFVDFYTAKGWRIGKDPMRDWQAAVRTWEQRDKESRVRAAPDMRLRDITSPDRYTYDPDECL